MSMMQILPAVPACMLWAAPDLAVLQYLDGATLKAACALNKPVRTALAKEQHIYSLDKPRFIHGTGVKTLV